MATHPSPNRASESPLRRLLRPAVLAGALLLALVIWFAVANNQRVTVDWFLVETSSPLFLVILVAALLGVLGDRLIRWGRRQRRSPDDLR
jgi:uncharacterized integral membrane protein